MRIDPKLILASKDSTVGGKGTCHTKIFEKHKTSTIVVPLMGNSIVVSTLSNRLIIVNEIGMLCIMHVDNTVRDKIIDEVRTYKIANTNEEAFRLNVKLSDRGLSIKSIEPSNLTKDNMNNLIKYTTPKSDEDGYSVFKKVDLDAINVEE